MRDVFRFAKFSWKLLALPGRLIVGVLFAVALVVGAAGTPAQQQQQNQILVLLSIAAWYWWVIMALTVALFVVLIRSYVTVEQRTLGLRVFPDRTALQKAVGSLEAEVEDAERVWMICLAGSTLVAADANLLAKLDRVIIADVEKDRCPPYMKMYTTHPAIKTNLRELAFQLQKEKAEVRWHLHPPFGLVIANPHSKKAWLRLELLLPYGKPAMRPSIVVHRGDRPELFDRIRRMFEDCWAESVDYLPTKPE
jgi:hypothetical protein